jgi:hypothetical protein
VPTSFNVKILTARAERKVEETHWVSLIEEEICDGALDDEVGAIAYSRIKI